MYARKYEKDSVVMKQEFRDHATSVSAKMQNKIAPKALRPMGILIGQLHDLGKLTIRWQHYFEYGGAQVNHAIWGARIVEHYLHDSLIATDLALAPLFKGSVQNIVMTHHTRLKDLDDTHSFWEEAFDDQTLEEIWLAAQRYWSKEQWVLLYNEAFEGFRQWVCEQQEQIPWKIVMTPLVTHYVYSCLIDSDWEDAAQWEQHITKIEEQRVTTLQQKGVLAHCLANVQQKINTLPKKTVIEQLRMQIHQQCVDAAKKPPAIYTLASPVGSGKTFSSVHYALKHAEIYKKKRLFIFLPYISLIEQNAEEIRNLLQANEWVLEHHGNVYIDNEAKLNVNWDYPIIITTFYQFMQAIYSAKRKDLRRFQYLSDSVLIFDEIQAMPTSSLALFSMAIQFISQQLRATVLFCTATQPGLDRLTFAKEQHILTPAQALINLPPLQPLIELDNDEEAFRRCEFVYIKTPFTTEGLWHHMQERCARFTESILCICNTKEIVNKMYIHIKRQQPKLFVYQLTTNMCGQQRSDILARVKAHLAQGEFVICLATSLIEAGINISFPHVYRSNARIDHIGQASGRCNRDGQLAKGYVYIFSHVEEVLRGPLAEIALGKKATEQMYELVERGVLAPYVIAHKNIQYGFQYFFERAKKQLLYPWGQQSLFQLLFDIQRTTKGHYAQHETVMRHYQMYGEQQVSLLAPYGLAIDKIKQLKNDVSITEKSLQRYVVNVYNATFESLKSAEAIEEITLTNKKRLWFIKPHYYNEAGLVLPRKEVE